MIGIELWSELHQRSAASPWLFEVYVDLGCECSYESNKEFLQRKRNIFCIDRQERNWSGARLGLHQSCVMAPQLSEGCVWN